MKVWNRERREKERERGNKKAEGEKRVKGGDKIILS